MIILKQPGEIFQPDTLVFKKIRAKLGGNVKGIVTGAAACPLKMSQFFSGIGIPIREGYGLTETSPAISFNRFEPYHAKLGTVGTVSRVEKYT